MYCASLLSLSNLAVRAAAASCSAGDRYLRAAAGRRSLCPFSCGAAKEPAAMQRAATAILVRKKTVPGFMGDSSSRQNPVHAQNHFLPFAQNLAFVPARPNDIDRLIRHISNRFHYANHAYRAQRHIVTVCARRCLLSVASSISARPVGQYKMTHLDKAMTPHSCTKMPNATASGYERNVSRFLRPGQLWQKGRMHAVQGVIAKNTAMLPVEAVPNAS